jgi:hypothetical protein
MAYAINHNLDGTYVIARLRMPATTAVALERALHLQEDVIRHMIIRGIMGTDDAPPEFLGERPRFAPRPMPMDRGEMRAPPVEAAPQAPASEAPSATAEEPASETPPAAAEEPASETEAAAPAEPAPAAESTPADAD